MLLAVAGGVLSSNCFDADKKCLVYSLVAFLARTSEKKMSSISASSLSAIPLYGLCSLSWATSEGFLDSGLQDAMRGFTDKCEGFLAAKDGDDLLFPEGVRNPVGTSWPQIVDLFETDSFFLEAPAALSPEKHFSFVKIAEGGLANINCNLKIDIWWYYGESHLVQMSMQIHRLCVSMSSAGLATKFVDRNKIALIPSFMSLWETVRSFPVIAPGICKVSDASSPLLYDLMVLYVPIEFDNDR